MLSPFKLLMRRLSTVPLDMEGFDTQERLIALMSNQSQNLGFEKVEFAASTLERTAGSCADGRMSWRWLAALAVLSVVWHYCHGA